MSADGDAYSGAYTGLRIFSATKAKEREALGDDVTQWLASEPDVQVVNTVVKQSSDNQFHCLTIVVMYRRKG